jgi:hypothetical protein
MEGESYYLKRSGEKSDIKTEVERERSEQKGHREWEVKSGKEERVREIGRIRSSKYNNNERL